MELQSFLKSIEIISDLPDDDINLIAENAHLMDFADGAVIIARGEPGRFLWIVYEGEVEVLLTGDDGSKSTIATLERTQVFGEMSILTGEPAVLDVIASGAAKLLRIPRDIFSRFIADNPKTLGKFTRLVTKRMLRNEQDDAQIRLKNICKENEDPYDLNFSSCTDPMKILTVNCGSSSLKYTLFDTTKNEPVLEGLIEKIGSGDASYMIKTTDAKKEQPAKDVMAIEEAFRLMVATVSDKAYTGISNLDEIKAIGHRVVHGGARFPVSVLINDEVTASIKELNDLAPLHNPYNLEGIELMKKLIPAAQQVAVFDTSFHLQMPENAYTYALPYDLCEQEQIRRYGFHGTNHKFVALSAATFLKRPLGELRMISCHGRKSSVALLAAV